MSWYKCPPPLRVLLYEFWNDLGPPVLLPSYIKKLLSLCRSLEVRHLLLSRERAWIFFQTCSSLAIQDEANGRGTGEVQELMRTLPSSFWPTDFVSWWWVSTELQSHYLPGLLMFSAFLSARCRLCEHHGTLESCLPRCIPCYCPPCVHVGLFHLKLIKMKQNLKILFLSYHSHVLIVQMLPSASVDYRLSKHSVIMQMSLNSSVILIGIALPKWSRVGCVKEDNKRPGM